MTRTLLVAWLLLLAPGSKAPVSTGTLVVLNKSEATASLIDLATGKVPRPLPTGEGPHEAATSPDGRLVLVANYALARPPAGRSR